MTVAKNCRIFVDGSDLACALQEIKFNQEAESVENTTLCNTGDKTFEPGLKTGSLSMSGIYDFDAVLAHKIDDVLAAALSTGKDLIVTASLGAFVIGDVALMAKGNETKYEVATPLGQLIMSSAEMQSDENILRGQFLYDGNATSTQATGTANDNAASSNKGVILHCHVYLKDDSTATDASFILQHSSDNSTWADLVASTAIGSTRGAFSATVAKGTTINRYTRIKFTATGGKAYGVAAFKRY